MIGIGRSLARQSGSELKVELSEHSIDIEMVEADKTSPERVWRDDLYRYGNVYIANYANPIKPTTVDSEEHDNVQEVEYTDEETEPDGDHTKLIRSGEYRSYIKQALMEAVLNPTEQWRLLVYGLIALGVLQFMTMILIMYATGSF